VLNLSLFNKCLWPYKLKSEFAIVVKLFPRSESAYIVFNLQCLINHNQNVLVSPFQGTHRWSQPHHSSQVGGAQYPLADGAPVRWEHIVDELHFSGDTVLFQLMVVLAEEPVGVGDAPVTILLVTGLHDVQTHTGGRHRCSILALIIQILHGNVRFSCIKYVFMYCTSKYS